MISFLTYLIWLLKVPTFQHKIGLKMKNDRIDSCSVIRSCDYSLACITVWNVCYWIQWTVSHTFFNSRQHTVITAQYVWSIEYFIVMFFLIQLSVLFISDHWVVVIFRLSREKKLVVLYRNAGYEPFFQLLHRIVRQTLFKNTKLVPDPMHMCRKWKCKWNTSDVDRCGRSVCSGAVDHGSSW